MEKKTSDSLLRILLSLGLLLGVFIIFIAGYSQGWNQAHTQLNKIDINSKYEFLCDSFNDGKKYNQEPCNYFYINATGNYCDDKIVCKNKLKED